MKVLMFGWEFPPFISGGLGTACKGITKGLKESGVDVSFVIPTKGKQNIETDINIIAADELSIDERFRDLIKRKDIRIENIKSEVYKLSPYYTQYAEEFSEKLFSNESLMRILESETKSFLSFSGNYGNNLFYEVMNYSSIGRILGVTESFDVIHAHDWLTYPAGLEAKAVSGKPLVIHVHATEFDRSGDNMNDTVYNIEKAGLSGADKIIAVSHYTKNILVNKYHISPDRIDVVHNAVEKQRHLDRYGIKKNLDEKIILFLGRVTMQKGPEYFLEAAAKVIKKIKNVRFVMAGSGDMLPRMINRMASLKLTDKFHFTGFLKGIEVEKMYALSDLYIMPSVSEPFGISPFEALIYDVPVIISKQSGISEILTNAVKVDFWDIDKLAETIISIINNPSLSAEIVSKCKDQMKSIEWKSAAMKIIDVYKNVVA